MSQTKAQLLDGKSATIQFTGGSASAPSVSFTGDTNTGIYSPGADQVAISTNSTSRLFIDANGHIGLTASASAWGDSANGSRAIQIGGSSWYNYRTSIVNFGHGYYYDASDNYRYVYTGVPVSFSQQTAGEHRWFGASSGTAGNSFTPLERMRLDSSGRLGVGTSSPSNLLHVTASSGDAIATIGTAFPLTLWTNATTSTPAIYTKTGSDIRFGTTTDGITATGFAENFRFTSTGRLGLGTATPVATLDVIGNARINSAVGLEITSSSNATITYKSGGSATSYFTYLDSSRNYIWQDNLTERMRLNSLGRLGVGTTSPSTNIEINAALDTGASVALNEGQLSIGREADSGGAVRIGYDTTNNFGFISSGRVGISWDRLILNAGGGNVGINNASPNSYYADWNQLVVGDGSGSRGITIATGASQQGTIAFADGTSLTDRYRGYIQYDHPADALYFGTTANERLRIDSSGRVGIGTSSPTTTLDCRGVISTNDAIYCYNTARDGLGIWYNPGGAGVNQLTARVAGGDRLTIDSSGRVGIGTASPAGFQSGVLHVHGSTGSELHLTSGGSGTAASDGLTIEYRDSDTTGGVFVRENGALRFGTNDQERARIDSSGRLLVGTSTSVLETVAIKGDGGGLQICRLNSGFATTDQALGSIGFKGTTSANSNAAAEVLIRAVAEENFSGTAAGSRLEFHTKANGVGPGSSPTERMRIRNNGEILFGGITSVATFNQGVGFGDLSSTTSYMRIGHNSTGAAFSYITFGFNTGDIGNIAQNSAGTAVSYNTTSDYRLKENVTLLTGATNRLKQLPVHRFNFIADPENTVDGFLAHEAQAVVPECVTGEKDAVDDDGNPVYQGIDQSKLVPLLTAALQEAIAEIETLKARLTAAGI